MSRLIDADELYRKFCGFEDSISESDMDKISATISSMPTAYDPDKVVEQLENVRDRYDKNDFAIRGIIEKAIEIVKGGGVISEKSHPV